MSKSSVTSAVVPASTEPLAGVTVSQGTSEGARQAEPPVPKPRINQLRPATNPSTTPKVAASPNTGGLAGAPPGKLNAIQDRCCEPTLESLVAGKYGDRAVRLTMPISTSPLSASIATPPGMVTVWNAGVAPTTW